MTGQELLNQIYYAYKGKDTSRHPAWGTPKASTAIAIANRKQREWATDGRNKWNSLFEIRALSSAIDDQTTTYDLDGDFFQPSDYARIVKTDGSVYEYPITQAQKRNDYDQAIYIHGSKPKQITFAQTIDSGLDGATIYVPGYYLPADITSASQFIVVDEPNWLVYITASELARNDASKDDQYVNLVNQANDIYRKMSDSNRDSGYKQLSMITQNMPAIGVDEDWTL